MWGGAVSKRLVGFLWYDDAIMFFRTILFFMLIPLHAAFYEAGFLEDAGSFSVKRSSQGLAFDKLLEHLEDLVVKKIPGLYLVQKDCMECVDSVELVFQVTYNDKKFIHYEIAADGSAKGLKIKSLGGELHVVRYGGGGAFCQGLLLDIVLLSREGKTTAHLKCGSGNSGEDQALEICLADMVIFEVLYFNALRHKITHGLYFDQKDQTLYWRLAVEGRECEVLIGFDAKEQTCSLDIRDGLMVRGYQIKPCQDVHYVRSEMDLTPYQEAIAYYGRKAPTRKINSKNFAGDWISFADMICLRKRCVIDWPALQQFKEVEWLKVLYRSQESGGSIGHRFFRVALREIESGAVVVALLDECWCHVCDVFSYTPGDYDALLNEGRDMSDSGGYTTLLRRDLLLEVLEIKRTVHMQVRFRYVEGDCQELLCDLPLSEENLKCFSQKLCVKSLLVNSLEEVVLPLHDGLCSTFALRFFYTNSGCGAHVNVRNPQLHGVSFPLWWYPINCTSEKFFWDRTIEGNKISIALSDHKYFALKPVEVYSVHESCVVLRWEGSAKAFYKAEVRVLDRIINIFETVFEERKRKGLVRYSERCRPYNGCFSEQSLNLVFATGSFSINRSPQSILEASWCGQKSRSVQFWRKFCDDRHYLCWMDGCDYFECTMDWTPDYLCVGFDAKSACLNIDIFKVRGNNDSLHIIPGRDNMHLQFFLNSWPVAPVATVLH